MPSSAHRAPSALLVAVILSACAHHPAVAPAPVSTSSAAADSAAALATRRAHDDSVRAANELAARRAREDSIAFANARLARLQDIERELTTPLYFDFDKSDLRPASLTALDAKLPVLEDSPSLRIRVEGNADERGSDEYNLALGMRRAAAARQFLVLHGIDSTKIDVVSYGKERPICTEHDDSCWQQNRRDAFKIERGQPRLPPSTT